MSVHPAHSLSFQFHNKYCLFHREGRPHRGSFSVNVVIAFWFLILELAFEVRRELH
jgi:hypothetical protein